jgi:hypothetical protein
VNVHLIVGVRAGFEDELSDIAARAGRLRDEAAAEMEKANSAIAETEVASP